MLTTEAKAALSALLERAKANPYNLAALYLVKAGKAPPPGDNTTYVTFAGDYRIVLTVEHQPDGWMKHLSLSLPDGVVSDPTVVDAIMQALAMSPLDTPDVFTMYTEYVEGYGNVLHVLEFCDPDPR